MALTGQELKRRIESAAALSGLGMRSLRDALDDYGANRTLAEAMIRGDAAQSPRNIRDLAETLHVPASWFTAEDFGEVLSSTGAEQGERLDALLRVLEAQSERMDRGLATQVEQLSRLAEVRLSQEETLKRLTRLERSLGVTGTEMPSSPRQGRQR